MGLRQGTQELKACLTPYFENKVIREDQAGSGRSVLVSHINHWFIQQILTKSLCIRHSSNQLDTLLNKTGKLPAFLELTLCRAITLSTSAGNKLII